MKLTDDTLRELQHTCMNVKIISWRIQNKIEYSNIGSTSGKTCKNA